MTLKNCRPRICVTQKKVQLSRILPFTGAARALGVKSEETIKANSISIVEILQYENSNKLNWSTQFSQYQRKFRFPFLSLPSKTLSADVCVCFLNFSKSLNFPTCSDKNKNRGKRTPRRAHSYFSSDSWHPHICLNFHLSLTMFHFWIVIYFSQSFLFELSFISHICFLITPHNIFVFRYIHWLRASLVHISGKGFEC